MTWAGTTSYAVGLAFVAVLTACGTSGADEASSSTSSSSSSSSNSSSSSSTPSSASSSSSTPAGRTLEVTIKGNKITPAPSTVELGIGETLTLTVTSDHEDQLHVHGFDVEKALPAGTPVSVELTGKTPGVYEVETHHPELRLLKVAVS